MNEDLIATLDTIQASLQGLIADVIQTYGDQDNEALSCLNSASDLLDDARNAETSPGDSEED